MAANDGGLSKKGGGGGGFYPNLASDADKCREFLVNFTDDHMTGSKPYLQQLQDIADRKTSVLTIAIDHLKMVRHTQAHSKQSEHKHNTKDAEKEMSDKEEITEQRRAHSEPLV